MPPQRLLLRGAWPLLVGCLAAGSVHARAQSSPSADIDPKAVAILQAMDDAFVNAEGLTATYKSESFRSTGQAAGTENTTLRLGRPNLFDVRTKSGNFERVIASDGKTRYEFATGSPRCTTWDVAPNNEWREISTFNPVYWSFFALGEWQVRSALLGHWATKWRLNDPGLRTVKYAGQDTIGGVAVDLIEWTYTIGYNRPEDDPVYTSVLAIGPDRLVRRIETTQKGGRESESRRTIETITDIKVGPRPAASAFKVQLPTGAQCSRVDPDAVYTTGKYVDLPVGSTAPDFTLGTARGQKVHFAEFLKQHKVVLMNYWGYG
jgi:outer membrane lipoprotein-sorting protein